MKGARKRVNDDERGQRVYHKVIGEAFVHGLMYYEGNMKDDIGSGKVVPKWFHLV